MLLLARLFQLGTLAPGSCLCLCIRPSCRYDTNCKQHDSYELYARVFLSPEAPCHHRSDAASGPQDNVYRDRDVVAEGMVIQQVDTEEQHNVEEPPAYGNLVRSEEERRSGLVELGDVAGYGNEQKLDKRHEGSAGWFDPAQHAPPVSKVQRSQAREHVQTNLMIASRAKTLEQHPPKINMSMAPTVSHCGMVSMKMRPRMPMILEIIGRWSSMPWISAFSRDGAALITRGVIGADAAACC